MEKMNKLSPWLMIIAGVLFGISALMQMGRDAMTGWLFLLAAVLMLAAGALQFVRLNRPAGKQQAQRPAVSPSGTQGGTDRAAAPAVDLPSQQGAHTVQPGNVPAQPNDNPAHHDAYPAGADRVDGPGAVPTDASQPGNLPHDSGLPGGDLPEDPQAPSSNEPTVRF